MKTILVADASILDTFVEPLVTKGYAIKRETTLSADTLKNVDVLLIRYTNKITKDIIDYAPQLTTIITCSVGLDHIDLDACKERDITIYNAPASNANAVAEHTVALTLAVLRHVIPADTALRNGKWIRDQLLSSELTGSTLGLVGFGAIAKLVAQRMNGFDVKVLVYDPFLSKEQIEGHIPDMDITKIEELPELLTASDIVSVHVPLFPETKHLIGAKELEIMKNTSILINTSRGPLVDEAALITALENKRILGAGLDVFEHEPQINDRFKTLKNVVLTPHLGSKTQEAQTQLITVAINNFLNNEH